MRPTFRDTARRLSPPRLLQEVGQKILYSLSLPLDGLDEWVRQAVKARFPELAPDDAIPFIGRDRQIRRGPNESRQSYVARLLLWLQAWHFAGVGFSLLEQLAANMSPSPTRVRIVTQNGVWYTLEPDGTSSIQHVVPSNWDWDGRSAFWARFWVIIYGPQSLWPVGPIWGDGTRWGDGSGWGTDAPAFEVSLAQSLVSEWKPAASRCENIIVAFDDASFDPASALHGTGMPDGHWGTWGRLVGGAYVPTRLATAKYLDGV